MSQATCKVCQNKIVIRKDGGAGTGAAVVRTPTTTPTVVSTEPPPTATSAAASIGGDNLPEQEMSESWREAIVDNRETINLLKKTAGVAGPDERSTAAGGRVADVAGSVKPATPTVPANAGYKELTPGESLDLAKPSLEPPRLAPATPAIAPRPATKSDDKRGASAIVSLLAGFTSLSAAASIIAEGTWSGGLGTLGAIGACIFAGVACTLNGLFRRRGILAMLFIVMLSSGAAVTASAGLFLLGGDHTRELIGSFPFLDPLSRFVR